MDLENQEENSTADSTLSSSERTQDNATPPNKVGAAPGEVTEDRAGEQQQASDSRMRERSREAAPRQPATEGVATAANRGEDNIIDLVSSSDDDSAAIEESQPVPSSGHSRSENHSGRVQRGRRDEHSSTVQSRLPEESDGDDEDHLSDSEDGSQISDVVYDDNQAVMDYLDMIQWYLGLSDDALDDSQFWTNPSFPFLYPPQHDDSEEHSSDEDEDEDEDESDDSSEHDSDAPIDCLQSSDEEIVDISGDKEDTAPVEYPLYAPGAFVTYRKDYTCPICLERPLHLISTTCGHVYCRRCIRRLFRVRGLLFD